MRRLPAAIAIAAALVGATVLLAGGHSSYRVAAIFDTAHGLAGGEQVKVAGVVVGTIDRVDLVSGPKARVVMSVKPAMGPFYRDATCTILPEGLISEDYVECTPGFPRSGRLPNGPGGVPTVPLSRTTVPASLQDLLNVFSLPVDDRARVLIDELGIATAGRGGNLNALLRRSNPALDQADRVLAIVDAQRAQLTAGIGQTGLVLSALANEDRSVSAFVDRTAEVTTTTADHSGALGQSIHQLPGLLDALRPGLRSLDHMITNGTPLLASLRSAAPELVSTTYALPSFVAAGIPALASLGSAARNGLAVLPTVEPVVNDLKRASEPSIAFADNLDKLLINTRDSGGLEGLLTFFYAFATLTAGYDQTSHIMTLLVRVFPQCLGNTGAPGCSFKYNAPGQGTIPPDDPACGPQPGAPWDPPTACKSILAFRRPGAPRPSPSHNPGSRGSAHPVHPASSNPGGQPATSPASVGPVSVPRAVGRLLGTVAGALRSLGVTGPIGPTATPSPLRSLLGYLLGR